MSVVLSDNYTVLKEFRTTFNAEQFNEKIVQVLLKYDFIVGDYVDDHLRLKGFYHDKRRDVEPSKRASRIQKYITESCNYMCSHYVLERIQEAPQERRKPRPPKPTKPKHSSNKKRYKKPQIPEVVIEPI